MKKFLVVELDFPTYYLKYDEVSFLKDSDPSTGTVSINEYGLLLSATFKLSELVFSDVTISNEDFRSVSCLLTTGLFSFVFDNDEMLDQFCRFYRL